MHLGALVLLAAGAIGFADTWTNRIELGRALANEGRYAEAKDLLEAALREAETFGPGDASRDHSPPGRNKAT